MSSSLTSDFRESLIELELTEQLDRLASELQGSILLTLPFQLLHTRCTQPLLVRGWKGCKLKSSHIHSEHFIDWHVTPDLSLLPPRSPTTIVFENAEMQCPDGAFIGTEGYHSTLSSPYREPELSSVPSP